MHAPIPFDLHHPLVLSKVPLSLPLAQEVVVLPVAPAKRDPFRLFLRELDLYVFHELRDGHRGRAEPVVPPVEARMVLRARRRRDLPVRRPPGQIDHELGLVRHDQAHRVTPPRGRGVAAERVVKRVVKLWEEDLYS